MKPYGQKHKKSKLGIHSSDECGCGLCNTANWKIVKNRDRIVPEPEDNLEIEIKTIEVEDHWIGYYKGMSVIGGTEEDCIQELKKLIKN